jgi:hypothetical protein
MLHDAQKSAKRKFTQSACDAADMTEVTVSSRTPSQALNGLVARISGYSSRTEPSWSVETAELVLPLIFNLGQP